MNDNLKAQSVYMLRQMYRLDVRQPQTFAEFREMLDKYELLVTEHNAMYNDNATSNIYFVDEKTIAQNYPL